MRKRDFIVSEIKIRYNPRRIEHPPVATSAAETANILLHFFRKELISVQEQFIVLYLDQSNKVIGAYCLSYGGITGTVADIRLILAVALKAASTQVILAHNHPSGNLYPSTSDKELTKKIKEAGTYMDIKVLDHLIIAPSGAYYSFADEGLL